MNTNSIVDYLTTKGQDSSLTARAKLAVDNGLVKTTQEYLTSAAAGTNGGINTSLLEKLQAPPAVAVPGTTPSTTSTTSSTGAAPSINGTTPVGTNAPLTSTQLANAATSPNPTSFIQANTGNSFADMVTKVAGANITDSNKQAIDQLKAQLEAKQAAEKDAQATKVSGIETSINNITGSTATKDALNTAYETYKVKENLALYNDIQVKIVEAQKALDMGLIYEGDRPARMQFITGAKSTLQQQGLATIGALQGTAAVIKGNIDLAKSMADATVNAINSDNERSFKALTTLLDLANGKLITLTADEKSTINDRINSIEKEAERLQTNKDDVIGYMTSYPTAFLKGGVTLLDNRENALKKMVPYLAAEEAAKLKADLDYKNSQTAQNLAQAKTSGAAAKGDSALTTATDANGNAMTLGQVKDEITQLKAKGTPYVDIINAYGALVPVAYINDLYGVKDATTPEERAKAQFYGQYFETDGSLKPGYKYTGKTDDKGLPVVEKAKGTDTSSLWGSIKSLWGGN